MFTKEERSGFKYWFAHWCYDHDFSDVFRFYDEGHYYKCFLTVSGQNTRCPHSSSGIVHDPNCPCKQNK